jgi:hypothetical protein
MIPRPTVSIGPLGINLFHFFLLEQSEFNNQWDTLSDARRHLEKREESLPFGINDDRFYEDRARWSLLVKAKKARDVSWVLKERHHYLLPK